MKYKVGDLVNIFPSNRLYLLEEIRDDQYFFLETQEGYISKRDITLADRDICIRKVN